jgi:hypothetical protein
MTALALAFAQLVACPLCAEQTQSPATSVIVVAFIAVPFAVSALVIRAIRNVDS